MTDAVLSWSGGKDAARALTRLRAGDVEVVELLTTVDEERDRSTTHGVRRELLARQAAAIGLPIRFVELPPEASNEEYEAGITRALVDYRERGVDQIAYGDVLLSDVREYREERLADTDLDGAWPIWGRDTASLAADVLAAEVRALVVAVDGSALDASFAGRPYDESFLDDLPDDVDPCGENGEFHTFVRDGPSFESPVAVERGDAWTRERGDREFHYRDLLPAE